MKSLRTVIFASAVCVILLLPAIALAEDNGTARLISVTMVSGGCVYGPTGNANSVQAWDVEPGHTYTLTIDGVSECAGGGTDPTLNVRVKSSASGNTDLVAVYVSPGVYRFDFTMPADASCTYPILYCTTPGDGSSGLFVIRNDGVSKQAHLRASRFGLVGMGCTNPIEILGPECNGVLGTEESNWGAVKEMYR
jgi:hypothetical protein